MNNTINNSVHRATIKKQVYATISEHLDIALDLINEHSTLEELGADSLDLIELIMAAEEQTELEIPDEEAENIKTVSGWIDYLNKRILSEK